MIAPLSIKTSEPTSPRIIGITDSAGDLICVVIGKDYHGARERAQRIVDAVNYEALAFVAYEPSGASKDILSGPFLVDSRHTCEEVGRG